MFAKTFRCVLFSIAMTALSIPAFAALNVAVEVSSSPAAQGELVLARLTVTNSGSSAAIARLEMPFPTGMDFFFNSGISDGGFCGGSSSDPGEIVTWNIGSLEPGTGKSVYFSSTVLSGTANGTAISFLARAFEGVTLRDSAAQILTVDSGRLLNVSAYSQNDPVSPNATLTYELAYGNRGGADVTESILRFPIPTGTTFVSATDSGTLGVNEVVWNLGLLSAGDVGRRRVTVQLGAGNVVGTMLEVQAVKLVGDANGLPQNAQTALATRIESAPALDFAIVTSNDPARPDEFLHTYLTVTNRSNAVQTGVGIQLFYNKCVASQYRAGCKYAS
jgi:uncharacterized repeat protein (TIGR01451 family)